MLGYRYLFFLIKNDCNRCIIRVLEMMYHHGSTQPILYRYERGTYLRLTNIETPSTTHDYSTHLPSRFVPMFIVHQSCKKLMRTHDSLTFGPASEHCGHLDCTSQHIHILPSLVLHTLCLSSPFAKITQSCAHEKDSLFELLLMSPTHHLATDDDNSSPPPTQWDKRVSEW